VARREFIIKRLRKENEKKPEKTKVDLDKYNIKEINFPFHIPETFRLFSGELDDNIIIFENKYGPVKGQIYFSINPRMVAFTGPNIGIRDENNN